MTANQSKDEVAFREWIATQVEGNDHEEVERTSRFAQQLANLGLQWDDVWHALRNMRWLSINYNGGCGTVTGPDLDGGTVEIVLAPKSDRQRLRFIKIWRPKNSVR